MLQARGHQRQGKRYCFVPSTCPIDGEFVALQPVSTKLAKADAKGPRDLSKKAIVLDLLRRKDGATLTQIAKATDRRTTASWVS